MSNYLSLAEAAAAAGISASTMARHVRTGLVPSHRLGGRRLVSRTEWQAFLTSTRVA